MNVLRFQLTLFLFLAFTIASFAQKNTARQAYNDGLKMYNSQNYTAAIPHFKMVTELNPKFEAPFRLLAICYDEAGKSQKAINYYQKVLSFNPKQADVHYNMALIFHSMKNKQQATVALHKALNVKPSYSKAKALLVNLQGQQAQQRKINKAIDNATKSVTKNNKKYNNQVITLLNRGAVYYNNKDFSNAAAAFQKALTIKEDAKVYTNLARCQLHTNEVAKAIDNLKRAVALNPDSGEANYYLSKAYGQKGNASLASKYDGHAQRNGFAKTGEKFNSIARGHFSRAVSLHQNNRQIDAIQAYQQAIQSNPNIAKYHYNLGMAYYDIKREEQAMASLEKTVDLAPQHVKAHVALGNLYFRQFNMEQAGSYYQEAIDLGAKDAFIYHALGNVYVYLGQSKKAISNYEAAVGMEPNIPEYNFNLGICYHKLGYNAKAAKYFNKTVALDSKNVKAHQNLLIVLMEMKRFEEAEKIGKALIDIDPDDGESYYLMGIVYDRMRDFKKKNEYMRIAKNLGYNAKEIPVW